jgi:glycosyltransferase involved in cell wall biosynthesis
MRVLVVGELASPHVQRWAPALAEHGVEVITAGLGRAETDDAVSLGSASGRARRYASALPALARLIRRVDPDVVHAHFVSSYGILAAATCGRRPLVLSAWGDDVLFYGAKRSWHRGAIRGALRRARAVTYDAEDLRRAVVAIAPDTRTVSVVFGPERAWTEAPRCPAPRILSARGFNELYWQEGILEAFAAVADRHPAWGLDVIDWGAAPGVAASMVAASGVADRTNLVPWCTRAELQAMMLRAEVVCSVPSSDGTAASLLEAMASGAFPVVSDVPANREWVAHASNGLVVRAGDVTALAEALDLAMADEGLRRRAAERNRSMIAERATWEAAVAKLSATYRSVLA